MNVKDTFLVVLWVIIFSVSAAVSFKVYFLDKDYDFVTLVPCDPMTEVCFVATCDPESDTYLEDICLTAEEGQTERYFNYIRKKMKNVDQCDSRDEECSSLVCEENEEGCEVITCNEETLAEYADEGTECSEIIIPEEETVEEESTEVAPEGEVPIASPETEIAPAPVVEETIPQTAPESAPIPAEAPLDSEPTHNLPI